MISMLLLVTVTILYAGYNLFIKVSGSHVPADVTSTILATICLQLTALATSSAFAALLLARGGQNLYLPPITYFWAMAAGFCIGGAEIAYFYLFSGIGTAKPMAASLAIPIIVSGTIIITLFVAFLVFKEPLGWRNLLGSGCIIIGIFILFLRNGALNTGS
jgi:drug/metabolite transporter (DMT)-like permease